MKGLKRFEFNSVYGFVATLQTQINSRGLIFAEDSGDIVKVSTIIPAYNAEAYIRESIDSALVQTYDRQEIIVVNDGSTDGTAEILAEYGDQIRTLTQPNSGRAAACNAGVQAATGQFIAFLDADDIWLARKLEVQVKCCGNAAISHTNSYYFGSGITVDLVKTDITPQYGGEVLQHLLLGNFITGSTVMLDKEVFWSCGGFDETYDCIQDWPLWLKICAKYNLGYVEEPLARYRLHSEATTKMTNRTIPAHFRVLSEAFSEGGVAFDRQELRNCAFAASYSVIAQVAAQSGNWGQSLSCASLAVCHAPLESLYWKRLVKSAIRRE